MKEDFLQLVWQQGWLTNPLYTTKKSLIEVISSGFLNTLQGPDFFNAMIQVDGQKWAGNIEVHVKSSDWFAHQHHLDENYKNVILHVVYEHDVEIYDVNNHEIPVVELKSFIPETILLQYDDLMNQAKTFINCESKLNGIDEFLLKNWLEKLYIERLKRKVTEIKELFEARGKDWEITLFLILAKYFGGNINGELIADALARVPSKVIQKCIANEQLEALLFGILGLLEKQEVDDTYFTNLKKEYEFLKNKFSLENVITPKLHFYGCRPPNYPTVKMAQLIALYSKQQTLFATIRNSYTNEKRLKELFKIKVRDYWFTHFTFGKESKKSTKNISNTTIDLLLLNVIAPILFLYHQERGEDTAALLELISKIKAEKNSIVQGFQNLKIPITSALESQAVLTLKKQYCNVQRCTDCEIGVRLMKS